MQNINKLYKITCILVCTLVSLVFSFFFFRYLAAALLPFVFAWGIALSLRKPVDFLVKKSGLPKKAAAIFTVLAAALFAGYIFFLFFSMLFNEGREIYEQLLQDSDAVENTVREMTETLGNTFRKIPYFGKSRTVYELSVNFDEKLISWISGLTPQILAFFGSVVAFLAKAVPYIALFLLVTVIAAFYFCADLENINRTIARLIPEKPRKTLFIIKEELFSVVFGYIRAYSLIIALTFTELFVGLSVIGVEYAFLVSFLIAAVDILPVLGTGTVLVPWGLALLVFGNVRDGACILVLYSVITVVRQLAEPKVVGNFLGLHPLCTLAAMYIGLRIAGITGLFLFPVGAIVARNVIRRVKDDGSVKNREILR